MSKNTFYILLGAFSALWLGGVSAVVGYAIVSVLFLIAGVAFDVVKHISIGFNAGRAERSRPTPVKPVLRIVK